MRFTSISCAHLGLILALSCPAYAGDVHTKKPPQSVHHIASLNSGIVTHLPVQKITDFEARKENAKAPQELSLLSPAAQKVDRQSFTAQSKNKDTDEIEDKLLSMLPFKNTLKQTWKVVDGDVDIMDIEGLRFDRGNTGVLYKTNALPFWGDVDGMEIEFCAGEKNEINFESSALPFVGKVDGFQMKSSVNEDNSRVYVSYTYKFD